MRKITFLSWDNIFTRGLLLTGFILRLRQYLTGRSLWLDEAMLALNIVHRNFSGLLQPLDMDQGAPIGFLFAQKLSVLIYGNNEYSLRLFPFIAGSFALWLFHLLLQRLGFSKPGNYFALALFTFSPKLISYSVEAKQYSLDVFSTVVLLFLAVPVFRNAAKKVDYLWLGITGVILFYFSHAVLFILAGVGLALLVHVFLMDERRKISWVIVMGISWLANLGIVYLLSLNALRQNRNLLDFWQDAFMPFPPWNDWSWFSDIFLVSLQYPLGTQVVKPLVIVMLITGWIFLFKRQKFYLLILPGVYLFALFASALGLYPIMGRMILYTGPILALAWGGSIEFLSGAFRKKSIMAWIIMISMSGYVIYQPLYKASEMFFTPKYAEHIRPTMEYLEDSWKEGDRLFVSHGAMPAFLYYAPRYHLDHIEFETNQYAEYRTPQDLLDHFESLRGQPRVWVLMSHIYEDGEFNERQFLLTYLDTIGSERREYRVPGTSVHLHLYNLNP